MIFIEVAIYRESDGFIEGFRGGAIEHINEGLPVGREIYLNCPKTATHIINNVPTTIKRALTDTELYQLEAPHIEEIVAVLIGGGKLLSDMKAKITALKIKYPKAVKNVG
jgi:hypothetical protein